MGSSQSIGLNHHWVQSPDLGSTRGSLLIVGNFLSSSIGVLGVCEELSDRLEKIGWRSTRTSRKAGRVQRLKDMVVSVIKHRHQYTLAIVEVYSGRAFLWAETVCMALRLLHKPYVLVLHGGMLPSFSQRWPSRVARLLRSAQAVSTPSLYLQRSFRRWRSEIVHIPNAIDIKNYEPVNLQATVGFKLCWLRAFHRIYNPELAVKVVALLRKQFPEVHLTMIGPDKGDRSLATTLKLACELGVRDRIEIIGAIPKDRVSEYLRTGNVFINTTHYESFGVTVLEAAACGLPIVTTNVGELPYLWENEREVLLVEDDDEDAMADAIRRILTDPELTLNLSRNARQKACRFDWSVVLPRWHRFLTSVCTDG